jgi:hypothetical protein
VFAAANHIAAATLMAAFNDIVEPAANAIIAAAV